MHTVKRIVQHARFNPKNVDYDFALLELTEPLVFDQSIQAVRLPDFNDLTEDNSVCLVTGWGNTQNSSESREQLRGAYVPIVNQKKCSDAYEEFGGVTPRMICAGILDNGGKDG